MLGPPGKPGDIHLNSSGSTSLVVQTTLSLYSYLAITSVTFVVSGPSFSVSHNAEMNLRPGQLVIADIQELEPNTSYSVYAFATNLVGNSERTKTAVFSTGKTMYPLIH